MYVLLKFTELCDMLMPSTAEAPKSHFPKGAIKAAVKYHKTCRKGVDIRVRAYSIGVSGKLHGNLNGIRFESGTKNMIRR